MNNVTLATLNNIHSRLVVLYESLESMGVVASNGGLEVPQMDSDRAVILLGSYLHNASLEVQGIADELEAAVEGDMPAQ